MSAVVVVALAAVVVVAAAAVVDRISVSWEPREVKRQVYV